MTTAFRVACVQTNSGPDMAANLEAAGRLIFEARDQGAEMILLPENVAMLEPNRQRLYEESRPEDTHPALFRFAELAKATGAWLVLGSIAIRANEGKVANRLFVLSGDGEIVARYDKIHLFDVDLGNGESYRESASILPGSQAVLVDTPWGRLGASICYDLRFPQLFRRLAQGGADFLAIPAAFTRTTGRAHWHVLIRARAIENGCFVFAPAQCGEHSQGRQTFGHSLIVDPWGEILAEGGDDVGIIVADIDLTQVASARQRVPALSHDRSFSL